MNIQALPNLDSILDPIIGLPYEQYDCWRLCKYLYKQGFHAELDDDPSTAMKHIEEIWFHGDAEDPFLLSQPWDLWIFRGKGFSSHHVGIMVDSLRFVHTRQRVGVCTESLHRWQSRLLQIARLRQLTT